MQKLTDEQWQQIMVVLPEQQRLRGGRPRTSDRKILNGILWVLLNGAKWSQLPQEYGAYVTCWRRFREWEEEGTWSKIWRVLLGHMDQKLQLEWVVAFLDGAFVPGKKLTGKGGNGK